MPTAGSCGTAKDRMDNEDDGTECSDWFFCTWELPEAEILKAVHTG